MEYNLINPSDPYTFIAKNQEIAALVVFLLGQGYGAEPKEGENRIPLFLFGGSVAWYLEQFGRTPSEGLAAEQKDIADTLLSFLYGTFEDRRRYEAALAAITKPEEKESFIREWQDRHTSLNDIGGYAHSLGQDINRHIIDKQKKADIEISEQKLHSPWNVRHEPKGVETS